MLLQFLRAHLEELPPIIGRQGQSEQIIRTMPFALSLVKGPTMPIHAFEIEHSLTDIAVATLMHLHHRVDTLHRTPGPHRPFQNRRDLLIGWLPLGTQSLTDPLLHDHHGDAQAHSGIILCLAHPIKRGSCISALRIIPPAQEPSKMPLLHHWVRGRFRDSTPGLLSTGNSATALVVHHVASPLAAFAPWDTHKTS